MSDSLLINALNCKNHTNRPPVWLMRQAGRYMPEYRKIREKHSFLEMCHTPEVATEVTLQPIKAFGMDAAILFSDILVIPEALRVGLRFDDGIGPIIEAPLNKAADVDALPDIDVNDALSFVTKAIHLLKRELKIPLLGFAGAPFTVASYMIEGRSSRTLLKTKKWMLHDPDSFHRLLDKVAECTIDYLNMQIEAGVDAIQIFDSWALYLSSTHFEAYSLNYLKKICEGIKDKTVPIILFCRGSSSFGERLSSINPHAISVDWNADLATMRRGIPSSVALQGNLDPDILHAPFDVLKREVTALLNKMKGDPGYIFNLGHGITPDISPDAVKVLVDTVKNYSGKP